jgi:hypothetical protein
MSATATGPIACLTGAVFCSSLRGLQKSWSLQSGLLLDVWQWSWDHSLLPKQLDWKWSWLDAFPLACTPAFLAGAYTARLLRYLPVDGAVLTSPVWYVVDSTIFIAWALLFPTIFPGWFLYDGPSTINAYNIAPTSMCVLLVAMRARCQGIFLRFFQFKGLVAFGPCAFSAFALHLCVLMFVLEGGSWHLQSGTSYLFFFSVSWLVAGLFSHFVEQPCGRAISSWKWLRE